MKTSNIDITNLSVTFDTKYGKVQGVDDVSITFPRDVVTGIIGETGSGKSLLGMSILRLLSNEATVTGQCFYNGQDHMKLSKAQIKKIRGSQIGFIPQNPDLSLNPILTIQRQLIESLLTHTNINKQEAKEKVRSYVKQFGFKDIDKIMKSYPFQLSGGMNQRILCIIGIICNPHFVIADEPTKGLDAKLRKIVYENLINVKKNYTSSMIVITHDLYFAGKFCDEIVVMYKGQVVETGYSKDVINNPKHPYTKGLIGSTIRKGMVPINPPDSKENPSNCKFYTRCNQRNTKCIDSTIEMKRISGGKVRCWSYD